jgi:hypothetical protein
MGSIINFSIIKSPFNWATVMLMALLLFALVAMVSPERANS